MDKERADRSFNEQPNLLDIDFPPTEEEQLKGQADLEQQIEAIRSMGDAEEWLDSLDPVPPEEKPRIDKIIYNALDRLHIQHQRQRPSNN